MAYFQFRYPKPQVVGTVKPTIFESLRAEMSPLENARCEFLIDEGIIVRDNFFFDAHQNDAIVIAAKEITTIALAAMDTEGVISSEVVIRRHPQRHADSWHRDGFHDRRDRGFVVSDKSPTQFVYGIHLGIDYIRARNQNKCSEHIAGKLTPFVAEPFEVAMFDNRTLHKRPDEGTDDRIFIRAILAT